MGASAMRLASYNVENLFERAKPMNWADWQAGKEVLTAYALLSILFSKPALGPKEKLRIVELLDVLGLRNSDESEVALLRQNHGRLLSRSAGTVTVVINGRADWVGWVELKNAPVNQAAVTNTGRIIKLIDADVLAVIEAENRPSLERFSEQVLKTVGFTPYPRIMLVDGNDERGIDVGVMARDAYPIRTIVSHVDDRSASGSRVFSRDCAEYEIGLPSGETLWLLVNHFKSKGYGSTASSTARRRAQAARAREIFDHRRAQGAAYVALVGDLNDTPDSTALEPLFQDGVLRDVSRHPAFVSDGRPGTWQNGTKANKLDYIILSPALEAKVTRAGVERRGVWGGKHGTLFPHIPEITKEIEAASDHAAIWVDLDI